MEPQIGRGRRATFLTHWPAPQAALARRDPADGRAALRFELFVAGMELANAFDELTDPVEQRARFERDVAERRRLYGADGRGRGWDVDEEFLAALEHGMPAGSGIALGFDRLAMLACGARRHRGRAVAAAVPRPLERPSAPRSRCRSGRESEHGRAS